MLPSNLTRTFESHLAPVVQKVDSATHWINLCPVDSAIHWINLYPVDSRFPNTYPLDSVLSS